MFCILVSWVEDQAGLVLAKCRSWIKNYLTVSKCCCFIDIDSMRLAVTQLSLSINSTSMFRGQEIKKLLSFSGCSVLKCSFFIRITILLIMFSRNGGMKWFLLITIQERKGHNGFV